MISVIIPIYNSEKFIKRCLDSILRQSMKNIEIICIDDGSTDNSLCILNKFAYNNSNIKIIQQKNKGASCARNLGLDYSKGEYILFVDSDDELEVNAIENLYNGFNQQDVSAVIGNVNLIFDNHVEKKVEYEAYFKLKYSGIVELDDNIINNFYVCPWGILYKTKVIKMLKLRFPEGFLFEDNYWHWCYFSSIKKVNFIKESVYKYYIRSGSVMSQTFSVSEGRALHQLYIIDKICIFWQKANKFNEHYMTATGLIEKMFFESIKYCPKQERAIIAYECGRIIKKFNLNVENNVFLTKIRCGELGFLYIDDELNEKNIRNLYILFLRFIKIIDKIFPLNSMRRSIVYRICRKIYKFIFKFNL